jgi:excisionase family DNA binding protein
MSEEYLTLKEAAIKYNVGLSTLRRKIAEGKISAYKPFGAVLLKKEDIEKFIKKSKIDETRSA